MYDVMATTRVGRSRREMRSSKEEDEDFYWSPDRHRTIDRDEVLELVPALAAARPQGRLPLLRLPDRRRAPGPDRARRGRALRRGDAERRRGDRGALATTAAPPASPSSRPSRASGSRSAPTTSSTRPASGPTGSGPRSGRGGGRAADRAQPRHPPPARPRRPADGQRRLHRPGRRGPDDLLPALVRAHPDRHHRQRLRGRHRPPPRRPRTTSTTCSRRSTSSSAPRSSESDLVGAYAGVRPLISSGDPRKSVDISRKAELYETSSGMLTITGGKLTTWRRMAKQTVDRLVEREGREAPCHTAEIPLGMEARPEDLEAPEGVGEEALAQLAFRYGHAARARPRPRPRGPEAGRADRPRPPRPAGRGGDRRPPASRRAASPTCCCAAPGWGSSRRRSCATPPRSARSPRCSAPSSAGRGARSSARPRPGRRRPPRPRASTPPGPAA